MGGAGYAGTYLLSVSHPRFGISLALPVLDRGKCMRSHFFRIFRIFHAYVAFSAKSRIFPAFSAFMRHILSLAMGNEGAEGAGEIF